MVSRFVSLLKEALKQEPLPAEAAFFRDTFALGVSRESEGRYPVWFILGSSHRVIGTLEYGRNGNVSYMPNFWSGVFQRYGIDVAEKHGIPVRYA